MKAVHTADNAASLESLENLMDNQSLSSTKANAKLKESI
jgi:hypothetical protein